MQKIAIDIERYGFRLSEEAIRRIANLKQVECYLHVDKYGYSYYVDVDNNILDFEHIQRDDPDLIKIIEEMGENVNDTYSNIKIIEIPDGVRWGIGGGERYDCPEWVFEEHRIWKYH